MATRSVKARLVKPVFIADTEKLTLQTNGDISLTPSASVEPEINEPGTPVPVSSVDIVQQFFSTKPELADAFLNSPSKEGVLERQKSVAALSKLIDSKKSLAPAGVEVKTEIPFWHYVLGGLVVLFIYKNFIK